MNVTIQHVENLNFWPIDEDFDDGSGQVAEFQTLALGDRLRYLRWLLAHADKLPQFQAIYDEFAAAKTIADKLRAAADALNLAAEIADDLPTANDISALSEDDVQMLARRFNIDWERLGRIAQWLIPILLQSGLIPGLPPIPGLPTT
jgi:hypothetical protein